MRRALTVAAVLAAAAALAVVGAGAGGDETANTYSVELDNAFGLVEGGDVKVAGVRAGQITGLDVDRDDMRALIDIRLDRGGFAQLRRDVFCEARQQSLIGEYFLDCQPGRDREPLPAGATIPVEQTGSTIPVDLVNNIMRRPFRERFSIILSELGAGLAARGDDLNETIRRANPALREVNRVLALLAEERETIRDLYGNADRVIGELAEARGEVSRFVREARDTSGASAAERESLGRQFNRLPRFLSELRPTLKVLGEAADRQAGALTGLRANAQRLDSFFAALGPFAEASRPAVRTLADAAGVGREAVRAATPRVEELRTAAEPFPEAAGNAAITLEHLNDPEFAVEKDARAGRGPDGGFTGLEAVLRYIWAQSQATNVFDANSHTLKVSLFLDDCANYADAARARELEHCHAWLGPNQPGVTTPDPSAKPDEAQPRKAKAKARRTAPRRERPAARAPETAAPQAPSREERPAATLPRDVEKLLDGLLPGDGIDLDDLRVDPRRLPDVGRDLGGRLRGDARGDERLLDFLLGP